MISLKKILRTIYLCSFEITTGCGFRGVRQSTSRAITQSPIDKNEGLRPDHTVFNATNYNASLLVDNSVVQSFPGSKNPSTLFSIELLIVLTTIKSTNINALVTPTEFPFYPLLWSLMISFTQLPTYFSKI
jgi:hypothetical protein